MDLINEHGVFSGTLLMAIYVLGSLIITGLLLDVIDYFDSVPEERSFRMNHAIHLPREIVISFLRFIVQMLARDSSLPDNTNQPRLTDVSSRVNSPVEDWYNMGQVNPASLNARYIPDMGSQRRTNSPVEDSTYWANMGQVNPVFLNQRYMRYVMNKMKEMAKIAAKKVGRRR
jgi:hypothetical protein